MSAPQPQPTNATPETFTSFDYVVVGGGTGGMACAAKLSDDPNVTVGVLEAGSYRPGDPKLDVPAMMGQNLMDPDYDWCIKTVPQKHSNNREWIQPRGKVLGGSSALNYLCWQRGYRTDFDDIAKLGNPGWDWDSLSPYYNELTKTDPSKITEKAKLNHAAVDDGAHGTSGAVQLSHSQWYCEAQAPWWNMLLKSGLDHVTDGSGSGETHGVWNTLVSVDPDTGKRVHAGTAFYEHGDFAQRPNFRVLCDAHAVRVELQESRRGSSTGANGSSAPRQQQRATGVTYTHNGTTHTVKAKREVIIAAGVYQSPQLLELSGIGSKAVLDKAGVHVRIANESVGENLQDHLFLSPVFETNKDLVTYDKLKDGEFAQKAMAVFGPDKSSDTTGAILASPCVTAFGYSSLKGFMTKEEIAELKQLAAKSDMSGWTEGMKKGHELQMAKLFHDRGPAMEYALLPAFFTTDGTPKDNTGYLSPLVLLQYPLSRGSVHVISSDHAKLPAVDPNYFANPADLRVIARALKQSVTSIEKDEDLSQFIVDRHSPSKDTQSIEQWEEFVKNHAGTTYHPCGSCSMMPQEMGGVVDSQLRVYGTDNLRVADASIMPIMPSGHIQSACYVIGYKAADLIRKQAA